MDKEYAQPFSVRIPLELRKTAEQAAQEQSRTLSNLLILALQEYLKQQGYLKEIKVGPL